MAGTKLISVLVILCHLLHGTQPKSDKQGQYEIFWKHMDDCGKDDALIRFHLRTRKMSRTVIQVEGQLSFNITVDDNIKMKGQLQKLTPSGWKENYLVVDFGGKGFCTSSKEYIHPSRYEKIFSKLYSATSDGNNQTEPYCPFEAGDYILGGVRYDLTEEGKGVTGFPKIFFYGVYRALITLYDKDFSREVGCIALYCDLVPKKNKNG